MEQRHRAAVAGMTAAALALTACAGEQGPQMPLGFGGVIPASADGPDAWANLAVILEADGAAKVAGAPLGAYEGEKQDRCLRTSSEQRFAGEASWERDGGVITLDYEGGSLELVKAGGIAVGEWTIAWVTFCGEDSPARLGAWCGGPTSPEAEKMRPCPSTPEELLKANK